MLESFDASLIGLTATPSRQTMGFFQQNLIMAYPSDQAAAAGSTSIPTSTPPAPSSPNTPAPLTPAINWAAATGSSPTKPTGALVLP
jgi:hypothetical protein